MANVVCLTYNPFQENTYLIHDHSGECIIFDPGCYTDAERENLKQKIHDLGVKPVRLINTHCHLDHVFGNEFIANHYGLKLEIHEDELPVYEAVPQICKFYGIPFDTNLPAPSSFIKEGEVIKFGNSTLEVLLTPGHSPASLSFYDKTDGNLIAGDVLFRDSIGRTDLPGGDYDTLLKSIKEKLLVLEDDIKVHPGHGPQTTIGYERANNPFLQ